MGHEDCVIIVMSSDTRDILLSWRGELSLALIVSNLSSLTHLAKENICYLFLRPVRNMYILCIKYQFQYMCYYIWRHMRVNIIIQIEPWWLWQRATGHHIGHGAWHVTGHQTASHGDIGHTDVRGRKYLETFSVRSSDQLCTYFCCGWCRVWAVRNRAGIGNEHSRSFPNNGEGPYAKRMLTHGK